MFTSAVIGNAHFSEVLASFRLLRDSEWLNVNAKWSYASDCYCVGLLLKRSCEGPTSAEST